MNAINRRFLLVGLSAFALTGAAKRTPRVLFICQAGTAKSAIAREFLRRRARERGIAVSVVSRGLTVEDHVSPPLLAALRAEGVDSAHDQARLLERRDLRAADVIVIFNLLPPSLGPVSARDWTALPSVNDAWPAARADLVRRIDALLDEVAKRQ